MTPKTNALKKPTAAQQGLEELDQLIRKPEATTKTQPYLAPTEEDTTSSDDAGALESDEELEALGSGARVDLFFVHKEYPEMKDNQQVIQEGEEFYGKYEGSFVSGKFSSRTHKIAVTKGPFAGNVIGLPTCGKLDSDFQFVPKGTTALVRFAGSGIIRTGKWKGSKSYSYETSVSKNVRAQIEAGTLKANYELKEKN